MLAFLATSAPYATIVLILFNLGLKLGINSDNSGDVYRMWALTPRGATLLQFFTSIFLHDSYPHFAGNMVLLWLFGRKVEKALQSVDFLLVYAACGFASAILQVMIVFAWMPSLAGVPIVGSSGAIAGIMGVYCVRFYRDSFRIGDVKILWVYLLLAWFAAQLVLGVLAYFETTGLLAGKLGLATVGYWAHIGGFIFGMGIALVLQQDKEAQKDYAKREAAAAEAPLEKVARYYGALELDPEDPETCAQLALTWASIDEFDRAREFYSRAVELYLDKGRLTDAVGRLLEFRAYLHDAMLRPDVHYRLCSILEKEKHYEGALKEFTLLSRCEKRELAQMALLRVGHIHLKELNRPHNAAAAYQRFINNWPMSESRSWAERGLAEAKRAMAASGGSGSQTGNAMEK